MTTVDQVDQVEQEQEEDDRGSRIAAADRAAAAVQNFIIYQTRIGTPEGSPDRLLWEFIMSPAVVPDLPVTQNDKNQFGHNVGSSRWLNAHGAGDRISYHTAWALWQHADPGHHDYINAIRVMFQDYGATNLVNDLRMIEDPFNTGGESQGLAPYPYERVKPAPVDKSRPGAVVELMHLRRNSAGGVKNQLLTRFTLPVVEPKQPKTRWYYQLNGLVVAVHTDFVTALNPDGVIAKCIIAGLHGAGGPAAAYTYRIQGVRTAAA